MTKLLEDAISEARELTADDQAIVGGLILAFTSEKRLTYRLTPEQIEEVKRTRKEVRSGSIATDEEMEALWRKFNA